MKISDIVDLTDEVKYKQVKGVVELGNLLEDTEKGAFEKDPQEFFDKTYLTDSLKEILENICYKVKNESPFGSFLISGNYGSGKSHILITLFHFFNQQSFSKNWLNKHRANELILEKDYLPIIIPLTFLSTENLWEPIFNQIGQKILIQEIIDYPTIPQIKTAIAGKRIVIFFDEIEKWYQSIDDTARKTRNKVFIQNLLHVANENNSNVITFISLLLEGTDLEEVINRQTTRRFDLHKGKEKKEIIRFRLFKSISNEYLVEEVINKYITFYYDSDFTSLFNVGKNIPQDEMRKKFADSYPFHPNMLDTLIARYQERQKYGNVRGLLYLLSSVLTKNGKEGAESKQLINSKDLILLSDVDLYQDDILALNRPLTIHCQNDYERLKRLSKKNIFLFRRVLSTCLIFSITETVQDYASSSDIMLSVVRPEGKYNPNEIGDELVELPLVCPHFHIINGNYAICREINPEAEINIKSEEISNNEAKKLIKKILKENFNKDQKILVGILEDNETKNLDNRNIKILISLNPQMKSWTLVKPFIKDTIFQNSFVILVPKSKTVLTDNIRLLKLAKRIIVENELIELIERKSSKLAQVKTIQKTDKELLSSMLSESYGFWLKYTDRDSFDLRKVKEFIDKAVLNQVMSDIGLVRDKISEIVHQKQQAGIKISHMKDDFFKTRGYPIIFDLKKVDEIILNKCKNKEFVIQDSHARLFSGNNLPISLNNEMIIFNVNFKDIPKFECEECQLEFETEKELEEHLNIAHPKFPCPMCSEIFKFATELQAHIENEHVMREFPCDLCSVVCGSESELFDHVKKTHESPEFSCPVCSESFEMAIELQKHMTNEHQSFECKICGKIFSVETELSTHIESSHSSPEFICKICGASFSKAEELQFHRITEHPEPVICHFCEEKFPSSEQLNKHILHVHERPMPLESTLQIIENNSLSNLIAEIEKKIQENDRITYIGLKIIVSATQEGITNFIPENSFSISEPSSVSLNYELNVNALSTDISAFLQKLPFRKGKFSLNLNIRRD